jgi:CubicO group peptidase (beta-lactamase class C family)
VTKDWFSTAGLTRLHDVMAVHVERGAMPGLIALVARQGRPHVEVIGTKAFGDTEPLKQDDVFRIASLTKPITAAAAMTMIDDGILHLDEPVGPLLPELANRRVLRSLDAELDDTVPAGRPITLDDLLTFRLGFGAILEPPGTYPIQVAEEGLQLRTLGPPWPPTPHTTDEWMRRFGSLPLIAQPGEQWMYGTGAKVLGALLERAGGKPLEAVLRERVFEPLGMDDTAFTVSPAMRGRLTTAYAPDPETGELSVFDGIDHGFWGRPVPFPDAGGWLLSTINDFWTFVQMMLGRGLYRGRRILSERSVDLMTSDHLAPGQRAAVPFLSASESWGLGMSVPAAGSHTTDIPRGFGWNGGTGTVWRSDVEPDLTGILFTQRGMASPEPPEFFNDFWRCAYEAIAG